MKEPTVIKKTVPKRPLTLSVDIGGTGIKMMVLDANGKPITERIREETPHPATKNAVLKVIYKMISAHSDFDRISVGFPGVVVHGVVKTAPNLDFSWEGCNLEKLLITKTQKPARVINDAGVQGYGDIKGQGVELVITLGTGMGCSLFVNGTYVPNLELAHHPFHKDKTYEEFLGNHALKKQGKKKWNKHVKQAFELMQRIFNFDTLYVGGGNAKNISFKLPKNIKLCDNTAGILGGIKLWEH